MNRPEIGSAFDLILQVLDEEIEATEAEAQMRADLGESQEAVQVLAEEKKMLEAFKNKVVKLRAEWERLGTTVAKSRIRRNKGRVIRRVTTDITPPEAFKLPILQALVELGGVGRTQAVHRLVESKMRRKLKPQDCMRYPSGPIVWTITIERCRRKMVEGGLLEAGTPKGIWAITDKGKEYLEQSRKHKKKDS
ncbi:hypothetical protein HPY42_02635 [Coprothermobacteraceae bacterium]|nr:hypothetical protein [Coprothermobacteraceae bacterium]